MEKKPTWTLQEVANWTVKGIVDLPTVQRGFVWKPSQIENLWDSLLRGYPVGAFVLSHKSKDDKFEMLDGQQRATAICYGFDSQTFRKKQEGGVKVFIDLEPATDNDTRKYIFRVITKSHPWGYQRTDNTKTLTADNIRKAMNLYEIDDHLKEDLNHFYPYDANLPIPFHYFLDFAINGENSDNLKKCIFSSEQWLVIKKNWDNANKKIIAEIKENPNRKIKLPFLSTDKRISKAVDDIYIAVKNMLSEESGQKIPALYLDFDKYRNEVSENYIKEQDSDTENDVNIDEYESNSDNSNDEIENLFIRLNAGGTPLRGEELNYSILKSNIDSALQVKIEDACTGFIRPARFITIAYRLYQHQPGHEQHDGLTMKIKPKQFQKTINDLKSKTSFSVFLNRLLSETLYEDSTLLTYAQNCLTYSEGRAEYALPFLIVSNIAETAPEVMFMFLYRIKIKGDRFKFNTQLHRKMLGMITLFIWLGKGEKQRDHLKLLYNIWPCASYLGFQTFWSTSTIQRALLNNVMTPFPSYNKKHDRKSLKSIARYHPTPTFKVWQRFNQDTGYGDFLTKIFYNKELLLYVQRKFLSRIFEKNSFVLEDTNMPFDWDHISPNKYIHRKFGIPQIIKDWYQSIGNYRAWPYSLNRMDQDLPPARKLNPLDPDNYAETELDDLKCYQDKWQKFIDNNNTMISSKDELSNCLLNWSYCAPEWANCWSSEMKKEKQWKEIYSLIINRNLSIAACWYKELLIEDLLDFKTEAPTSFFNTRRWELLTKRYEDKEVKSELIVEDFHTWISKPIIISESIFHIFYRYSQNVESILDVNQIQFGFYEKQPSSFIKSSKIHEKDANAYITDKKNWVVGFFTLTSFEFDSYTHLLNMFNTWILGLPNNLLKNNFSEYFQNSLLSKYKSEINS